ncbi:MAG TPA: hypothetical protein VN442_21910 [Bryobacteraceae bacterium]|nr:hypothetical protein [Bryobacteraceae bacterium]
MLRTVLGILATFIAGAAGAIAVLKSVTDKGIQRFADWPRLSKIAILLVGAGTLTSSYILILQAISQAKAEARLAEVKAQQDRLYSILVKQELLRSIRVDIGAYSCSTDQVSKSGILDVGEWAMKRRLRDDEAFVLQLFIMYQPVWLDLIGVYRHSDSRWFYTMGLDSVSPGPKQYVPFPETPGGVPLSPSKLLDGVLSQGEMRRFLGEPPHIAGFVANGLISGDVFDPRFQLGFFEGSAGLISHVNSGPIQPPFDRTTMAHWTAVPIAKAALECWDVYLWMNDRMITNLCDSVFHRDTYRRFTGWPTEEGKYEVAVEKLRGKVWLAPLADNWSEFRPVMNGNVQYLLYGDSPFRQAKRYRVE